MDIRSRAFTLAEVLITLGIVGVVAALTIPGLITTQKAIKLRSQFLKSYSLIQQSFKLMEEDDVSLDPNTYESGTFYKTYMKYFTGTTDCTSKRKTPCYYRYDPPYKSLDGKSTIEYNPFDDGQFTLKDGTLVLLENYTNYKHIWVSVDINGYGTPPNRWGYDLFTFQFKDGELVTMGDQSTEYKDTKKYCDINGSGTRNGIACAQLAKTDPEYFKKLVRALH